MCLMPEDWGFALGEDGGLVVGGRTAVSLALEFGTPLQVIDEAGLRRRAREFSAAFKSAYPGELSIHFAWKCNNTPGVVAMTLGEGLCPEVGTLYEWRLARALGVDPSAVIVNGPAKGELLPAAVREGAGLIVLDGPADLEAAERAALTAGREVEVLLRVNPDWVPQGMNRASATGSRLQSVFGFDLRSGEVLQALRRLAASSRLRFAGLHAHIGTGIRSPRDYRTPLRRLLSCLREARRLGLEARVLDIGGGFGVPTSREFCTREFLLYQGAGRLPLTRRAAGFPAVGEFAAAVSEEIVEACRAEQAPLPRLVVEPGRSIVSSAGLLLVTVDSIKSREGAGDWAVTDGGAGTVAFPLFYELHEILLCRAPLALRSRRYNLVGPACHSADWLYRNKRMPPLLPGDVLAVCDAGAYFTVQESNFGFPRPPIVAVRDGQARLLRRRESFEDMVLRDLDWRKSDAHS